MDGRHGDEIAADVEIGDIVLGEIDGETPTGRGGFETVVEAYCRGGVEEEVRG